MPGTPSLIGFDEKYFVAAMNAYRSGQRKDETMKSIAVSTSDAEIRNLALYYALQKPAAAQTKAKGNAAAGRTASAACAGCHGEQGVSGNAANPSLAGQEAEYLAAAMRAYKDGARSEETMKLAAAGLGDAAIADLAAYYAAQQPKQPKVTKPLTLANGCSAATAATASTATAPIRARRPSLASASSTCRSPCRPIREASAETR